MVWYCPNCGIVYFGEHVSCQLCRSTETWLPPPLEQLKIVVDRVTREGNDILEECKIIEAK